MTSSLRRAFGSSWPPETRYRLGGFDLPHGPGAGARVNAAQVRGAWTRAGIDQVAAVQRDRGQTPLFMVKDGDRTLAAALEDAGLVAQWPTRVLAVPVAALAAVDIPPLTAFALWPPLAIQRALWTQSGIGAARQAVMDRVGLARAGLLGRISDRAAGVGFVAADGDAAMLHALAVLAPWRRAGLAWWLVHRAAIWARDQGSRELGVAVSDDNIAARALYGRLGFTTRWRYRYFTSPR